MTPQQEVAATIALLNDERGRGGQAELARRLDCDVRSVRNWTYGQINPLPVHMKKVRAIKRRLERNAAGQGE